MALTVGNINAGSALTGGGSGQLTRPVNTVFNQTLLRNARSRCVHFLGSVPGSVATNAGSTTVTWRRISINSNQRAALAEISVAGYMVSGTPSRTPSTLTFTAPTATALKYGNYIPLNEEIDVVLPNGTTDKIMEIFGIDAGDYMDYLQRVAIVGATTTVGYAGGAASEAAVVSKITRSAIKARVVALDKAKAMTFSPMTTGSTNFGTTQLMPGFIGITHPDVCADVCELAGFKPLETYAGQVSPMLGEYGAITVAGRTVRFVSGHNADSEASAGGLTTTTGLITSGATNIDTYTTLILGMDATGSVGFGRTYTDGTFMAGDDQGPLEVIHNPLGSGGTSDPLRELSTIGYKFWHAATVLNTSWINGLISGATLLA